MEGSAWSNGWHILQHRVYYGEVDQMGWVYYGNYPAWFEQGRTEYLRACGVTYRELEAGGVFLPVRRLNVRYWQPARYDDVVSICTRVERLRRVSITFLTEVRRGEDERLVEGVVELACVDRRGRPQPLPAETHAFLERCLPAVGD